MPVPEPRWLLYLLFDPTDQDAEEPFYVGVHPALTGGPVPALVDSSWLASGEGLPEDEEGADDVADRLSELFDRGGSPRAWRWCRTTAGGVRLRRISARASCRR